MESNLTSFKDWEVWNMYTKFEEEIKHLVPVFDDPDEQGKGEFINKA